MNQQLIDQLVKLATIRVNNPLLNSDGKVICDDWQEGVSMSKLIELTVRECLNIVEPTEDSGDEWCVTLKETSQQIREHFGVEL